MMKSRAFLFFVVMIILSACSRKYSLHNVLYKDNVYKDNVSFNDKSVYAFMESEQSGTLDSIVLYTLTGTELGTQLFTKYVIKNKKLREECVYMTRCLEAHNNTILRENTPISLIPLYTVSYIGSSYSITKYDNATATGNITNNGSSLDLFVFGDKKHRTIQVIDFTKATTSFLRECIAIYSFNMPLIYPVNAYISLIGSDLCLLTNISTGITDNLFRRIVKEGNKLYLKPLYYVGFTKRQESVKVSFNESFDSDSLTEYIENKDTSIVYYHHGFSDGLSTMELFLIDYNKVVPVTGCNNL